MSAKHEVEALRQVTGRATTRLSGHELQWEGAPYVDRREPGRVRNSGHGFGLCSCGETSQVLPTNAARKRWHKIHKLDVIAKQS